MALNSAFYILQMAYDEGEWGKSLVCDGDYLYEITANGGIDNMGVLFRIKTDGSSFEKLYNFDLENGAVPEDPLILVDSILYGTTSIGGPTGAGGVFAIKTDGTAFENLLDFDSCFELPLEKSISNTKLTRNDKAYTRNYHPVSSTQGSIAFSNNEIYISATAHGSANSRSKIFKYCMIPTGDGQVQSTF